MKIEKADIDEKVKSVKEEFYKDKEKLKEAHEREREKQKQKIEEELQRRKEKRENKTPTPTTPQSECIYFFNYFINSKNVR